MFPIHQAALNILRKKIIVPDCKVVEKLDIDDWEGKGSSLLQLALFSAQTISQRNIIPTAYNPANGQLKRLQQHQKDVTLNTKYMNPIITNRSSKEW
jgi:hypothetical protein